MKLFYIVLYSYLEMRLLAELYRLFGMDAFVIGLAIMRVPIAIMLTCYD